MAVKSVVFSQTVTVHTASLKGLLKSWYEDELKGPYLYGI